MLLFLTSARSPAPTPPPRHIAAGNINLDGSKNTVCGSAVKSPQGKVTLSKVPKSVTGLTKAAVSTQFSDFLFTQS
jgi:hypothetical protein